MKRDILVSANTYPELYTDFNPLLNKLNLEFDGDVITVDTENRTVSRPLGSDAVSVSVPEDHPLWEILPGLC